MSRLMFVPAALLALSALSQPVLADDAGSTGEIQNVKAGEAIIHAQGVITAIDAANRVVSIKNSNGKVEDVVVGPEAKNFDQLRIGDHVRLDYRRAVALALKKGGAGIRSDVETTAMASAPAGDKPGGFELRRRTIVANVLAVDHKKNTITVKGPKNRVVEVEVSDPEVMREVKKGDQVVAVVTDAIAISVTPGK